MPFEVFFYPKAKALALLAQCLNLEFFALTSTYLCKNAEVFGPNGKIGKSYRRRGEN